MVVLQFISMPWEKALNKFVQTLIQMESSIYQKTKGINSGILRFGLYLIKND